MYLDMEKTRAHRNFDELIYDRDASSPKSKDGGGGEAGEKPKEKEEEEKGN